MPTLKTKALMELSVEDLKAKYAEMQGDLSRVKAAAARGAAKKEVGKIRPLRRNIARVLTVINAKRKEVAKNE